MGYRLNHLARIFKRRVKTILKMMEPNNGIRQVKFPLCHLMVPGNFSHPVILEIIHIPAPIMVMARPKMTIQRPMLSRFGNIALLYRFLFNIYNIVTSINDLFTQIYREHYAVYSFLGVQRLPEVS